MSNTHTHAAADRIAIGAIQMEERIAHYPKESHQPIIRLTEYIRTQLNASLTRFLSLAREAGVTRAQNTWYQIFAGKYFRTNTGADGVMQDIAIIFDYIEQGIAKEGRIPFVETSTWQMVEDYIDAIRAPNNVCRIGIIVSNTGTQKTACLEEYRWRNNHGTTARFEAPATPRLNKLLLKWVKCYSPRKSWKQNSLIEIELRAQLNEKKVVIIENAQRLYQQNRGAEQEIFSFLQEIQEDTGCILILCWTRGFTKTFLNGSERAFFEQFVGRVGGADQILSLPEKMPVKDLRKVAAECGVEDIENALPLLKEWAKAEGKCRILFSKLQKAKRYAEADGSQTISTEHLEQANNKSKNVFILNEQD